MSAHATLFHPFHEGLLDTPGAQARVLFLGAEPGFVLPDGFEAELFLVQGFRPAFLALLKQGWQVAPQASGAGYDLALVLCTRHRGENEARMADALARMAPGALLVVAGAKSDGIDSLRKRTGEKLVVRGHASKHHGTAFWLRRPEALPTVPPLLDPSLSATAEFVARPGMFSHAGADPGSRLLAAHLPGDLKGSVADFGAGWGYLAVEVARCCSRVAAIDLFEADFASLEAAGQNMARHAPGKAAGFFWHDLLAEPVERRYDAIVMNPPFHQGRAADPAIGQAMIAAAAKALGKGGRLLLVANRGLPYEAPLRAAFAAVEEIARDGSFKVLAARR